MATPTFFNTFKRDIQNGTIDADDDSLILALSNHSGGPAAADAVLANIDLITEQNGYSAVTLGQSIESDGGTGFRLVNDADESWTASGGSFGPFRWPVIYDDTPTSPADPLICFWDVGSETTITVGNTFTVDFDANFEIYTLD